MGHSKNFSRVFSIYKNDVISLGHKLTFVQLSTSRFATQILRIKTDMLTFFLFTINEPANMGKFNNCPCFWKVKI